MPDLIGFARLTADKRREVTRRGGQAVKPENRFFSRDRETARDAARKGGKRRREPNPDELELLLTVWREPYEVPEGASGRLLHKVSKLVRLGYIKPMEDSENEYIATREGMEHLRRMRIVPDRV